MEAELNLMRHGPIPALPPHMDPYRQRQGAFLQKRNGTKGIPSPLRHSMTHFDWESEDEDDAMDVDSPSSTPPSSPPRRVRASSSSPLVRGYDVDPMVADAIHDFNQIVSDILRKRKVSHALKRLRTCISTINYRIQFLSSTMRDDGLTPSLERERDVLMVEMEGLSNLFKQVKPQLKKRA